MAGKFFAVGPSSKRGTSPDGSTWTTASNVGLDTTPSGVAFSDTLLLYVVAGAAGNINKATYAADNTWSNASSEPFTSAVRMVGWNPDLALFVGGAEDGRIATSSDGDTWTQRQTGGGFVRAEAWSPSLGLWVVAATGGASGRCFTSPDGITWTARTTAVGEFSCAAWGAAAGVYVIAGRVNSTTSLLQTSANGTAWTTRTATLTNSPKHFRAACWSDALSLFAVGSEGGEILTSPDGITWTARTSTFGTTAIRDIAWSPDLGIFLAVGDSGKMATSPDGITWTAVTVGTGAWLAVVWVPSIGGGLRVRGFLVYR